MSWWLGMLIVLVLVVIVAGGLTAVVLKRQRERTAWLRERFGPEYDRAMKVAGGRRAGEAELEERLTRRQALQLRAAGDADRADFDEEWSDIEAQFETAELAALARADALVTTVLAECGYPMDSFDQRAADLSVDHPEEVGHYRRAHDAYLKADKGEGTREDFYEALQHYRAFLDALLDSPRDRRASDGPPQRPPRPLDDPEPTKSKR